MTTTIGKRYSFSELRHQTKQVIETAMSGPVILQKHGKDALVLIRADDYAKLLTALDQTKDTYFVGQLPDTHKDTLTDAFEQHLLKRDRSRAPG